MENISESVGKNLGILRKSRHLTQQELAEKIGYSDKSLSKWELGKAIPSVVILKKLADFYGVTIDSLIREDGIKNNLKNTNYGKNMSNKIVITCMAACFVLFAVASVYVSKVLNGGDPNIWVIFVWAWPLISLVCGVLDFIYWGRNLPFWILCSALVWGVMISIALTAYLYAHVQLWYILVVGIPVQIAIILMAQLK